MATANGKSFERWLADDLLGRKLTGAASASWAKLLEYREIHFGTRFAVVLISTFESPLAGGCDVQNPELVAKVERWLNDVSAALHRLSRERDVLRETRTRLMMGVLSEAQAEANLSRLVQWRDGELSGLPADIVERLR